MRVWNNHKLWTGIAGFGLISAIIGGSGFWVATGSILFVATILLWARAKQRSKKESLAYF